MAKQWTHAELCKKAVSWLKRPYSAGGTGCPNAFSEVNSSSNGGEIVDSIGLKTAEGTETIVIEVKVSRADFLADKRKPFRVNAELGMGNYRYYLCPEGLINETELPERWGLLEVGQRGKVSVVCGHVNGNKQGWYFNANRDAELGMTSLLMAKAGNFETLNAVTRLNARLESKVFELQERLRLLEFSQLIKNQDVLQAPIPRRVNSKST